MHDTTRFVFRMVALLTFFVIIFAAPLFKYGSVLCTGIRQRSEVDRKITIYATAPDSSLCLSSPPAATGSTRRSADCAMSRDVGR